MTKSNQNRMSNMPGDKEKVSSVVASRPESSGDQENVGWEIKD